jgi:hypothetical protein
MIFWNEKEDTAIVLKHYAANFDGRSMMDFAGHFALVLWDTYVNFATSITKTEFIAAARNN